VPNKEFNFSFNELHIDYQMINSVLGYENVSLPEPFENYLKEAISLAAKLPDIKAVYRVIDKPVFDEKPRTVKTGEFKFNVAKTVYAELQGSDQLAFFVCTAGKTICEKAAFYLKGEDPVYGYIFDLLGSAIVEAACYKMQSHLKEVIESSGSKITNRYSPGYCHWSVADQHKLFSLLGETPCGVSLTDSSLMSPVKSVSGIIGIGPDVRFREYQCTLCLSENCAYRRLRPGKGF
jgi:hypothetical protein